MNIEPIPTSPKVQKNKKEKTKGFFTIIFLSMIFGLFSGILGEMFINSYLSVPLKIPFIGEVQLMDGYNGSKVTVIKQNNSSAPLLGADDVSEFAEVSVSVFEKKQSQNDNFESSLYQPSDKKGNGVYLSNDGWILTTNEVITDETKKYIVINNAGKIGPVEKIIKDPISKFIFCKTSLAGDHIVTLSDQDDSVMNEQVYIFDSTVNQARRYITLNTSRIASFNQLKKEKIISSTDFLENEWVLDASANNKTSVSPVFSINGKFIGFGSKKDGLDVLLPAHYIHSVMNVVIKSGVLKRSIFGIKYIQIDFERVDEFKKYHQGAYIESIENNSPFLNKLQNGDIVIKINSTILDSEHELNELLHSLKEEENGSITYIRGSEESTMQIKQ